MIFIYIVNFGNNFIMVTSIIYIVISSVLVKFIRALYVRVQKRAASKASFCKTKVAKITPKRPRKFENGP